MGYKTRGTQKNSNQSVTRSYHLLTVRYTNINPDQKKKNILQLHTMIFNKSFKAAFDNGVNFKLCN